MKRPLRTVDDVIRTYADTLRVIQAEGLFGDSTYSGLLHEFLVEVDATRRQLSEARQQWLKS